MQQCRGIEIFFCIETYFDLTECIETFLYKKLAFCSKFLNQFSIKTQFKISINSEPEMFQWLRKQNVSILYTIDAHFQNSTTKIGSISYFSSSYTRFNHFSRMPRYRHQFFTYLFLSALCFQNLICHAKSLIRIIASGLSSS